MAETKNIPDFQTISSLFWANISTGLRSPLGCLELLQFFFGSSPMVIEWDATWIPLRKDQKQQSVLIQAWDEKGNILVNYFILLLDHKIKLFETKHLQTCESKYQTSKVSCDPIQLPLNLAMLTINFYSNTIPFRNWYSIISPLQ